eukprot:3417468-Rhodomonas_salina.4
MCAKLVVSKELPTRSPDRLQSKQRQEALAFNPSRGRKDDLIKGGCEVIQSNVGRGFDEHEEAPDCARKPCQDDCPRQAASQSSRLPSSA